MAKKALSAPEIPLCINVLRLLNYRLAPDELILFDWLTVKQISFKYKPFHYSQARVEEETRIRRTRQEVIIKQFSALGFLKTDIKVNSVTRGRVRYYSVDFSVLADVDVLVEIIMINSPLCRGRKYNAHNHGLPYIQPLPCLPRHYAEEEQGRTTEACLRHKS